MKKVLMIFMSLFIMFSFTIVVAQDEVNAQDPDDMRAIEKPEVVTSKTIIVNGQVVQEKPVILKTQKAFTLRERNKLAQIEKAKLAAQKNASTTQVLNSAKDTPRGAVSHSSE